MITQDTRGASHVTVMQRFARSWPKHPQPGPLDQVWCVPIAQALPFQFEFDAHFAAYRVPATMMRRLSVAALDAGVAVEMTHATFDFDDADIHGTSEPARAEWRARWRESLGVLAAIHPGPFAYETKGGGRVTYALPEPTVLRSRSDAQRWRQNYAIACSYLARCFGLAADAACGDWTRLYRLPDVVRDGVRQQWPVYGDANQVGVLEFQAAQADVDAARALLPAAFRAPRLARLFRPQQPRGEKQKLGILFHALDARGATVERRDADSFVVRCPNDAEHTTGSSGDGSTVLYLPGPGDEVGAIHCFHGHCAGKSVGQWLGMFSEAEVGAARQASGITVLKCR